MSLLPGWLLTGLGLRRSRAEAPDPRLSADSVIRVRIPNAGLWIDENNALTLSAVWACVRIISETLASLPWRLHLRRSDGGSDMLIAHPIDQLIHLRPNREMTANTFIEGMQAWALTWGNGYAEIERNLQGEPVALWPIEPHRVRVERDALENVVYVVKNGAKDDVILQQRDVFHLHGLGYNGLAGYSVISLARESMSLGLATERYGAGFFGNSSRPSGVLEHPQTLTDEAADRLRESWEEVHKGSGSSAKTAVLEEGMTWKSIAVPPEDAQFLQTRKFQVEEIARWYRVPPHKIAQMERSTFSNIEQQAIEFVTDTIVPWASRWEREADWKLLGRQQRSRMFTRYNVNGLLRGDTENRFKAYATGRQWGWLSINDVRRLEDMNPIPDGDDHLVPMNMVPADQAGRQPESDGGPAVGPPAGGRMAAGNGELYAG